MSTGKEALPKCWQGADVQHEVAFLGLLAEFPMDWNCRMARIMAATQGGQSSSCKRGHWTSHALAPASTTAVVRSRAAGLCTQNQGTDGQFTKHGTAAVRLLADLTCDLHGPSCDVRVGSFAGDERRGPTPIRRPASRSCAITSPSMRPR